MSAGDHSSPLPIRKHPLSSHANELIDAYSLTPPDDTVATNIIHHKCLIKIREELDEGHNKPSSPPHSYQSWYDGFQDQIDDLKETITPIQAVSEKLEDFQENVETFVDRFDNIDSILEDLSESHTSLSDNVDKLEVRMDRLEVRMDRLEVQVENAICIQRNAIVSRFYDIVTPLRGQSNVLDRQNPKQMKWYWKLHQDDRTPDLIQLHEYYQIQPSHWLGDDSNDNSEDDDSTDLNQAVPYPSTISEAVRRYRGRAVRVLFGHLGLRYEIFEKFENERRVLRTQGPVKRGIGKEITQERSTKHQSRAVSGTTKSDMGSTTQAFTSPTQTL